MMRPSSALDVKCSSTRPPRGPRRTARAGSAMPGGVHGQVGQLIVHGAAGSWPPASASWLRRLGRCLGLTHREAALTATRARPAARPGQRAAAPRGRGLRTAFRPRQVEHVVGKLQQPQRVGHRRPALAEPAGDLGLGEIELVGEDGVGPRLLDRVQILAGDVLRQRQDQALAIVGLRRTTPGSSAARPLGGAPAALAGDDLVPVAGVADDDRLDDALGDDRVGQLRERILVERAAGAGAGSGAPARARGPSATPGRWGTRRPARPGRGRARAVERCLSHAQRPPARPGSRRRRRPSGRRSG